jgi:hypothetical protein
VNELPQGTLDALLTIPGTGVTIVDGEDCEAIREALHTLESNSDDCCRPEPQCHYACQRQTWFESPGCSGVYSVNGNLVTCVNNTVMIHMSVDIWRRDRRSSIGLLIPLT